MTVTDAIFQIRSLRARLDVLEARLRGMPLPQQHTLADLWGIPKDEAQTTAEEIDAVIHPYLRGHDTDRDANSGEG